MDGADESKDIWQEKQLTSSQVAEGSLQNAAESEALGAKLFVDDESDLPTQFLQAARYKSELPFGATRAVVLAYGNGRSSEGCDYSDAIFLGARHFHEGQALMRPDGSSERTSGPKRRASATTWPRVVAEPSGSPNV